VHLALLIHATDVVHAFRTERHVATRATCTAKKNKASSLSRSLHLPHCTSIAMSRRDACASYIAFRWPARIYGIILRTIRDPAQRVHLVNVIRCVFRVFIKISKYLMIFQFVGKYINFFYIFLVKYFVILKLRKAYI